MKNIDLRATLKWIAFAFAVNLLNSILWNSAKGFILVNTLSAAVFGLAAQYCTLQIIEKRKGQDKATIIGAASILLFGLSFWLNYAMVMKLMSTTVGHSRDLWWFLF